MTKMKSQLTGSSPYLLSSISRKTGAVITIPGTRGPGHTRRIASILALNKWLDEHYQESVDNLAQMGSSHRPR